jgi:hypothetical protein
MDKYSDIFWRFMAGEKVAIHTGNKHRQDLIEIVDKEDSHYTPNYNLALNAYREEVLCLDRRYNKPYLGYCDIDWFERNGYEIYPFESVFQEKQVDLSDFEELL